MRRGRSSWQAGEESTEFLPLQTLTSSSASDDSPMSEAEEALAHAATDARGRSPLLNFSGGGMPSPPASCSSSSVVDGLLHAAGFVR